MGQLPNLLQILKSKVYTLYTSYESCTSLQYYWLVTTLSAMWCRAAGECEILLHAYPHLQTCLHPPVGMPVGVALATTSFKHGKLVEMKTLTHL